MGAPAVKKILLVDDEPAFRVSAAFSLTKNGFAVSVASDGHTALGMIVEHGHETQKYDLLVADMLMPGMTGLALVKELRAKGFTIPVLLVTGVFESILRDHAWEMDGLHILVKPFEPEDLNDHVLRLTSGNYLNGSLRGTTERINDR